MDAARDKYPVNPEAVRWAGAALLAAALFGVSAPVAKVLLEHTAPLPLAGLLYLGSGLGLSLLFAAQRLTCSRSHDHQGEARLRGSDFVWLAGATLCGGVLAPVSLMLGLSVSPASSASLLLNLEGVLTALVAGMIFRESIGGRVWMAVGLMFVAAATLSWEPATAGWKVSPGSLAIVGACLLWAADNNLTRHLSSRDPFAVARLKGLTAGPATLLLARAFSQTLPGWRSALSGLALGAVSYGASLVLFVYALRHLGAARTSGLFGVGPFIGAAVSVVLLREAITPLLVAAGAMMAVGTWVLLAEAHGHEHVHERFIHEHRHAHEDHHEHGHEEIEPTHSHAHEHALLLHSHAHVPDLHHRHGH